jgi:hypothetical protein
MRKVLYTPLPTLERTWESISMDYMSGFPSTNQGKDCIFLVVDQFSKMAILTAYKKSITLTYTANLFFERVWVHLGYHIPSYHIGKTISSTHFG